MDQTDQTIHPDDTSYRRRAFRPFLIAGFMVVIVFIVTILGTAVFYKMKMSRLMELQKHAKQHYARNNESFAFDASAADQSISPARWSEMFEVRRRLLAKVTPETERVIRKALGATSQNELISMATGLLDLTPALEALLDEHLAALEEARMSVDEYRWLLGLAVREMLKKTSPEEEAGPRYWSVLEGVAELSGSTGDPAVTVSADQLFAALDKKYDGRRVGSLSLIDELQDANQITSAVDLLAVGSMWSGLREAVGMERL